MGHSVGQLLTWFPWGLSGRFEYDFAGSVHSPAVLFLRDDGR